MDATSWEFNTRGELNMREKLERRLEELKKEFYAGKARMADLEEQQLTLQQTLLRISGAIQVLEEELTAATQSKTPGLGNTTQKDLSQINGSPSAVRV